MEFQSERLLFRPFSANEYGLFSSIFYNEKIMEYAYMNQITDEDEMKSLFGQMLVNSSAQNKNSYEFAVFSSSDGNFVGYAAIFLRYHLTRVKHGEIGYFLLPGHWGKGFATEIAKKLTEICFTKLNLRKVVASCNANNSPSEKVMIKTGMTREGEFRRERYKNGRWDNELLYGILIDEWKKEKGHTSARIGHVAIWSKDIERLKDFYTGYFGGIAGEKYRNEKKQYESYFIKFESGARLELMQMPDIPANLNSTAVQYLGIIHIAMTVGTVEKVESLTYKLRNAGYSVVGEPRHTGDGYYESCVLDPDGNRIEITL